MKNQPHESQVDREKENINTAVTTAVMNKMEKLSEDIGEKYPLLEKAANIFHVRKGTVVLGISCSFLLIVFFGVGMNILCILLGSLSPAYLSHQTIERANIDQNNVVKENPDVVVVSPLLPELRRWLMYWVVFGIFAMVEVTFGSLLHWFPFYYMLKLTAVIWLLLPRFCGSTVVYTRIVAPLLSRNEQRIENQIDSVKNKFNHLCGYGSRILRKSTLSGMRVVQSLIVEQPNNENNIGQEGKKKTEKNTIIKPTSNTNKRKEHDQEQKSPTNTKKDLIEKEENQKILEKKYLNLELPKNIITPPRQKIGHPDANREDNLSVYLSKKANRERIFFAKLSEEKEEAPEIEKDDNKIKPRKQNKEKNKTKIQTRKSTRRQKKI